MQNKLQTFLKIKIRYDDCDTMQFYTKINLLSVNKIMF